MERSPDARRRVGDEQLGEVVVSAIADALRCESVDVPPLHGTVDLDALESLFGTQYDGTPRTGGRVAFVHEGCTVVVEPSEVRAYSEV